MTNCNSLETTLARLSRKLDSIEKENDKLRKKNFEQDKLILGLQQSSRVQRLRLDALSIVVGRIKKGLDIERITRLEKVVDTILRVTNSFRKSINDLQFFADRQLVKNDFINNKNRVQDTKITSIDRQLTAIKVLLALITAAGGFAAFIAAKLAPLLAKDRLLERLIRQLEVKLELKIRVSRDGAKGDRGERGFTGLTGNQGFTGLTGERGFTGLTGNQGLTGLTGNQGLTGLTGNQGLTGLTGERGFTGERGDRGDIGLTGERGDRGDRGEIGERGIQGIQGLEGQVTIIEVPTLVYEEPDLTLVLAKIQEIKTEVSFTTQLSIPTDCQTSTLINPTGLKAIVEGFNTKLTAIEKLVCDDFELEDYVIASNQTDNKTFALLPKTKFVKIEILFKPSYLGKRFGRVAGETDLYNFGDISFGSDIGFDRPIPWNHLINYFYPLDENIVDKIAVYCFLEVLNYSVIGYKIKDN